MKSYSLSLLILLARSWEPGLNCVEGHSGSQLGGSDELTSDAVNSGVEKRSPFHCTRSAKDKRSCVRLDHCVWCQAESPIPGICVSEAQTHAIIHRITHVKCWRRSGEKESNYLRGDKLSPFNSGIREIPFAVDNKMREGNIDEKTKDLSLPLFPPSTMETSNGPYDPICLNAPVDASAEDKEGVCDSTNDSQGEKCVWCDADGVFGLCLSHKQAIEASTYLQCDI